jgi:MOSC domain-containing protein YiiM
MGRIEAICVSEEKGTPKRERPMAVLVKSWGIEGDAHAGDWHRQVSLLAGESIDRMKEKMSTLTSGAFAENFVTRGIDLRDVSIGDEIAIGGSAVVRVTQIGKECHTACAIKEQVGDCIMPREGIFAEVLTGGTVKPGDGIWRIDRKVSGCDRRESRAAV